MGEAIFCTPTFPKPLNQFGWLFKYVIMSAHGEDLQNLVEIDSAVTNPWMSEKKRVLVGFFVNISIY